MKRKHKPFSRLSAAQKRVAIARDAIKQIKAQHYNIVQGQWCEFGEQDSPEFKYDQGALRDGVVKINIPPCNVCALGAAMVSSIRLFNAGEAASNTDIEDVIEQLERFFSREQMALIEQAFEERSEACSDFDTTISDKKQQRAADFSDKIKDVHAETREEKIAIAIFKNIIKNNGTFVP